MHTKPSLHFTLLVFFFIISAQAFSQGFLRAKDQSIVNNNGSVILRGMGLGGWMLQEPYMLQMSGVASSQHIIRTKIEDLIGEERTTAFYNAWLANHCTKADIDSLKRWGFNSVRLPMHYNLFTLPVEKEPVAGKNTWLQKGFALTDSLLAWCKANQIYLILDLHAAPGGQGNDIAICDRDTSKPSLWQSELNQQKTIALWRKLAQRYANETWIGGYDLINETNWGFTDAKDKNGCAEKANVPLRKLLMNITSAIREVDKNHLIFLEANCWANNYSGILPAWDNNMAVSFHKYWNYNDQSSIQNFINIRKRYNIPVWLGESGENSNVWFRSALELLEKNEIGWAWWPLKKLGFNNPLQINPDEAYQRLLNYWQGKSGKPSADEAFAALMQLAESTNARNTTYHKDVIDAMFRQTASAATRPFKKHTIKNNAIVFAVDYDLGRNGFAYYDNDTANYRVSTNKNAEWNKGHQYRNDGVDIAICKDSISNGYCVGWTETGEWLNYTIDVEKAGSYDLKFRTASKDGAGSIQLMVNGMNEKSISFSPAGSGDKWVSDYTKAIQFQKGINSLRLYIQKGGFSLNYIQFNYAGKK